MAKAPKRPRRQHFIPRLLLRGFASRIDGDTVFVYQFRAGATPREVSIVDVGVAQDFYGSGDLEDKLRAQESLFGPLVRRLAEGEIGPSDRDLIDQLVTNLIVRTRNARDGLGELMDAMASAFERVFEDEARGSQFERLVRQALGTNRVHR